MTHIKFSHSLADIPNPHPVLLVGETHTDFSHKLYTMRSLQHLQKMHGYTHHFGEHSPREKLTKDAMAADLKKYGSR